MTTGSCKGGCAVQNAWRMRARISMCIALGMAWPLATVSAVASRTTTRILAVERVWAGHPVNFGITGNRGNLYLAYYDAERRMTVASLPAGGADFIYQKLDSVTGWDSHNY